MVQQRVRSHPISGDRFGCSRCIHTDRLAQVTRPTPSFPCSVQVVGWRKHFDLRSAGMEEQTRVRLLVMTQTDDGRPLLLGVSGENGSWPAEDFAEVEKDLVLVLNFGSNEPFSVLQAALSGFLERTEELHQAVGAGERPGGSAYREVQVHLYAFLTAMRSFLDQSDRRLKREFGADSGQRMAFKSATSREFDANAAYRFLYHLRNHVQHHSVPLGPAAGTSTIVASGIDEESVEHAFSVGCDRDQLLSEGRFPQMVTRWLKEQDKRFEIAPLLSSCMNSLRDIRTDFDRQRAPAVLAAAERLEAVLALFEGHVGEPGYGHIDASGTDPQLLDFISIPMERYSLMVASARMAADAASVESGEFLLVDAPEYQPVMLSFGPTDQ